MGEHPAADEEAGLDRAATADDAAGGSRAWPAGLGLAILIALTTWGGIEGYGYLQASALVESLKTANTTECPGPHRADSGVTAAGRVVPSSGLLASTENDRDHHLRASLASLALLPDDGRQADYLYDRLLAASPVELPVIWGILQKHHPGIDAAAVAIARRSQGRHGATLSVPPAPWRTPFRRGRGREKLGCRISVHHRPILTAAIENPGDYATLSRPCGRSVSGSLTPLASIFRDAGRSESERTFATTILADYASRRARCAGRAAHGRRPEGVCEPLPGRPSGRRPG